MPHDDRVYVDGTPVLSAAAQAFTRIRPRGRRFEFRPETMEFVALVDEAVLVSVTISELAR